MQRTVRVLRIVLPIAFAAFVLLIVLSWKRTRAPRDRAGTEPVAVTRTGEKPQIESKGFEDTQTISGRVVSRIRAARVVAYSSNWNTLEDVQLTIFRANGLTYDLKCPEAQFNSQTKEAEARGGVTVASSDGISLSTAAVRFDGNRLTNHVPVQFTIDQWRGKAGALDLDVEAENLRLFEGISAASVPAGPDDVPMSIKAGEGLFRRKTNDVNFAANVVLTRLADRLTGDRMQGRFGQNRKTLVGLEGQGHITMAFSSALSPGEDLGGRKEVTCDRFFSDVTPDGQISAINAVGETALAHAVLDGPPKRDVVARSFHVALANRAVTELKADWDVVVKEFGDIPREISSDHITIGFDPQQHRATTAYLEGSVKYHDPKNSATAVRANYDIVADRVVLTAIPGFSPKVVSEGNILEATQIEFSPKAGTARASGHVLAQLASKQGVSADSSDVFPAGKPVFVNSDLVVMRQENKVAVFSGNVKAWQETNTLFAQELQVQGAGDSVTARGNVRTILYNTDSSGPERKLPVTSQSEQLLARKSERRLDLTGNVRIIDDQQTMTSEQSAFFFDANHKLERVESETKVVLIDAANGRKATGDKAVYQVARRIVLMHGKPATATAPTGTLRGEDISIDLARNKVEVLSPTSATSGTYKTQKP